MRRVMATTRRVAAVAVLAAVSVTAGAGVASAGNAGSGSCNASKGTLWCGNEGRAALYRSPGFGTPDKPMPTVDRLYTTYSWFSCWTTGDRHSGGNTTWYRTKGDVNGRWGFVPASNLYTYASFDKDKTKPGLERC